MQSDRRYRVGTYTFGTALFLVLAVVLAFASGDLLLVLAVVTASAGLGLLATQRKRVPVPQQAMVRSASPARPLPMRHVPASRAATKQRMAERRSRPILAERQVAGVPDRSGGARNAGVSEPARQSQPI